MWTYIIIGIVVILMFLIVRLQIRNIIYVIKSKKKIGDENEKA
jgi:hypothetical protein